MLFKDTKKLQEYAELTNNSNFFTLKATLRMVESYYIIPVLGKELYNALDSAYTLVTDENTLSPAHKLLIDKCRCVIGPMLCYLYAPKGEVKLGDGGLTKNKEAAYQYQGTNYREANLREGELATELLLEFLEENKEAYPQWTASNAFAQYRSLFIKTGSEFQQLFPSHSPYRNYMAMRAKMVDVEEQIIRTALGNPLFEVLKTKDKTAAGVLSEKEKELLFKVKKTVANYTVAFSIPLLSVRIDANGLTVATEAPRSSRDADNRSNATAPQFNNLVDSCTGAGQIWLTNALQFITDNIADFPAFVQTAKAEKDTASANTYLGGSFGMV